jgi:hypothetical protein
MTAPRGPSIHQLLDRNDRRAGRHDRRPQRGRSPPLRVLDRLRDRRRVWCTSECCCPPQTLASSPARRHQLKCRRSPTPMHSPLAQSHRPWTRPKSSRWVVKATEFSGPPAPIPTARCRRQDRCPRQERGQSPARRQKVPPFSRPRPGPPNRRRRGLPPWRPRSPHPTRHEGRARVRPMPPQRRRRWPSQT